jgi:mannose-1-phosphate guanylyltransferase/phosphomannomutase
VKGIIMAGGFGTRLRPLTNNLPKPMVPMVNRPIMEHILALLKRHAITDLTALLYFQPEIITNYFGDGKRLGVNLDYISATVDLGTAGAVGAAMRKYSDTTLVISGDVLTDIDLNKAIDFHKRKRALATIVLTRVENPLPFGIVITDKSGRVTRFLEKPGWGEVFSDTINTGIYILEKKVLPFIPEGREFDFSKDLFPLLLEEKKRIYGYIAEGYWKDVGSLEEYRQANMDILQDKVNVEVPGEETASKGVWTGIGSRIDFSSNMEGKVVIGERCKIEAGARVVNSIVGDNAVIEEGAVVMNSVLWNDLRVGRGALLQENVVASFTEVCERAHLGEGAIVSDHCRIGRNSSVRANVKVWPYKHVEDGVTLASSLIWGQKWAKNIFSPHHGVTGLANIELSPEFAAKLGAAYGAFLGKGTVVSTSRDAHKTSRMINRAVMTGILSTGVNVHDYGVTPMPVVRYLARGGYEMGGIHTRRSPFDPLLLDIKFFDRSGLNLHPGHEKAIEKLFFQEDFTRVKLEETGELVFPVHGFETYQSGFMSSIDTDIIKKAGFKIVLDYSYGSSARIFPAILGRLNCDVIALNANLDATKTTKSDEEFNKCLNQLSSIVRSLGADVGIFLDSGGEKIYLVDDTGDILDGETALNLVTLLVLKTTRSAGRKGAIAVPVTASRAVEQMAKTYRIETRRTKMAPRGLMEAATAEDVLFVGESKGGFIFPQFQPGFDGMYAAVKVLEMLASVGVRMHKLIREIPPSIMVKERIPCSWENKGMLMRRLAEDSRGMETALIDGIRINFGDDWFVAYPSQSRSSFNVIAEASTEERAREIVEKYAEKIRQWQRGPVSRVH